MTRLNGAPQCLFEFQLAEEAQDDLKSLRAFDRSRLTKGIEQHLTHQPTKISKGRIKRMVGPFWCEYRLRADEYRVYYDVEESAHAVHVLRIIEKGQDTTPEENP